jgi:acid phosphatase type 7
MFKGLKCRALESGKTLIAFAIALGLAGSFDLAASPTALAADQYFYIKPYLQLGFDGKKDSAGLDIVWFSEEAKHKWQLKFVTAAGKEAEAEWITERMISLPGFTAPYYKVTAHVHKVAAGDTFDYRVLRDGTKVFEATAKARKGAGQSSQVAIFGDCGVNGESQRRLAQQVSSGNPDLVIIPGDIAYQYGLFSQYVTNFFPVYNLDAARVAEKDREKSEKSAATTPGVPLMRSIPFVGIIGNHDIALSGMTGTNLNRFPDALAYFIFWNQPLNGFTPSKEFENKNFPYLAGDPNRQELFKKSAGDAFPTMANYSFDFGEAHYTCLDGNYYMDWNNPKLREWLANDLKSAQGKAWRIISMHQPGFLLGAAHAEEQKMRLISDIAQKYNVNLVIAGHSHCYERSYPLTFDPRPGAKGFTANADGTVDGVITLDKAYDGNKSTKPKGIIYVVSGAGGANIYPIDKNLVTAPNSFIDKYDSAGRSYSALEVDNKQLTFKQIGEDGKVIDKFIVSK